RCDFIGPVEHVRDRSDGYGCGGCDITHTHCHCCSSFLTLTASVRHLRSRPRPAESTNGFASRAARSMLRTTSGPLSIETIHAMMIWYRHYSRSMSPMTAATRVCFQLQIRTELLDEYLRRHSPVRPEMLAEIAAAGRRNYSLFLGEGGTLIGYYETDDDAAARAYLAQSEVATRWESEMARFFVDLDGRPDQA